MFLSKFVSTIATSLLLTLTLTATSLWTPIANQLDKSVVYIEMETKTGDPVGSCSGFVIDNKRDYILTAAHCNGEKILVDQEEVDVVAFKDARKDLMVLHVPNLDKPALKLAKDDPQIGEEVASYGYGYGLEKGMFRVGHVSQVDMPVEELSGPFTFIDAPFVPGQSGGPVVNDQGEVVMIVQRTAESFGLGVPTRTIKERVGKYFDHTP